MTIVKNNSNPGRTIWGVLGHEAHIELVDGRYIVVTRHRTSVRRTSKVFDTMTAATDYLTRWTTTDQMGA